MSGGHQGKDRGGTCLEEEKGKMMMVPHRSFDQHAILFKYAQMIPGNRFKYIFTHDTHTSLFLL